MIRPSPDQINPQDFLFERYLAHPTRPAKMRAYYAIKPLLPRALQLALRRAYARRQAQVEFPAWPIEPLLVEHRQAALREAILAGGGEPVRFVAEWPEGHGFAAILTHDVEGPGGFDNVARLIEIEHRYGLRSSWNFVAEDYAIPPGMFEQLRSAGCEIGLHGIKHDGKLFASEATFAAALPSIQHYLAEWRAVGFRSPSTHRNADWMPRLGCLYDSSFPDTDPFEPQPGGCCSIFPFHIGELVELPITLPQDHTIWEILRQRTIEQWRTKAEWIIANRGLINVIVHPDYVVGDLRVALYEEFCAYLRDRLDAAYGWHALPREVASWWNLRGDLSLETNGAGRSSEAAEEDPLRQARVAMATYNDGELVIETTTAQRESGKV